MSNRQLLLEYTPLSYSNTMLLEAADTSKLLVLRDVILQRANNQNQNGRVYPKEILAREAKTFKDKFVSQRMATGELDHPESPVVNLKNSCVNVTDIWFDGNDVRGNLEILTTPSGNIVRELIKNNIRLGISSRGVGSVKQMSENSVEVQEDFSLICFDIVSNPSTQGAFINENTQSDVPATYSRIDTLIYDFLGELK